MDALWDSGLRFAPSIPLALAGLCLLAAGLRRSLTALSLPPAAARKNLRLMTGLRRAVLGLALAAVAAGWAAQTPALLVLGAVIGLGELFETSLDVAALRREAEWQEGRRRQPPKAA